jgi:hypothetical protein
VWGKEFQGPRIEGFKRKALELQESESLARIVQQFLDMLINKKERRCDAETIVYRYVCV